ncbi:MAG: ABC transporter ATP-binding protein [Geminicoccaceae bacterium]|nr:ABC transporter ATP-binding protein [Geminicoccaceae bacterium]
MNEIPELAYEIATINGVEGRLHSASLRWSLIHRVALSKSLAKASSAEQTTLTNATHSVTLVSGSKGACALSQNGQPKLTVANATKYYDTGTGRVHALDDFSIEVQEGELACLLGPSGCGKSTLLWAMAGLHGLSSGEIRLDGKPVTKPNPQIAMVFQEANLLPWRNLIKNIELPFEIRGQRPDQARIDALLAEVGLTGFESKMPRELSGGMQQRASIVRALSVDPSLLLMDEPFGALDAFTRDEMNLLIQQIWMETRKTIVFITHNIAEAVFLADRVFVMSARPGRLARIFEIDLPRPRNLEIFMAPHFIELVGEIKGSIDHKPQVQAA